MGNTVIKVEGLSKKYRLGVLGHGTLRQDLQSWWARLRGKEDPNSKVCHFPGGESCGGNKDFWALKDVSFDVKQGEVLGIIGRNGAGKSTLLKILSRVTSPTSGTAKIKGRIASLLEVGTGFHPELTGRENIYINGAILGMTKKEIDMKFDEIVAFAEVEQFIDTPVKRYSSGMYVRLAFAVAAHLEPEILIVDEVLAVGDVQFQKKCLGKMKDVSQEGRTVLFVSHNMGAVEGLCSSGILLDKGEIKKSSNDVRGLIQEYMLKGNHSSEQTEWINCTGQEYDNPYFKPLKFYISDENGNIMNSLVRNDSDIWVNIEAEVRIFDPSVAVGYAIYAEGEDMVYISLHTDEAENNWPKLEAGINILRSKIPKRFLNEGTYRIELIGSLFLRGWLLKYREGPYIYVTIEGGLSDSPYWITKRSGFVAPVFKWEIDS
ncbi:MAG: ABC transporter ATP-binding protein [Thermincola sp.]|jgi:lipopolysaccharide transport system ATP-binding protein|nr:ABC transporter ATP-binding protein [Thermincola sp.]MDT3703452.1 ABC transporter ATP-binding protein [Thermincola sp.]